ncbi:TetR/AcrR family transcriptional regulator [Fibrella sp. HMF5335]|uniref:TetR/AcrR family transcriptional regulator n=1 Tax=Fibrella rubiginis TaxID=2817060 RepID=A0A939K1F2_9BACT|nr:TetR/AcrR family transcriptional regulator [Fibrella rubiginis]MBO0935184.1 TetR/AcrR family transcriptional regulator [Fibrella rubiginis]
MARPKAFAEQDALQAAMETFWRKGYHQTSMQDLVDAMGINRASLYDTFVDKHTLYKQALERYRDLNCAEMAESIAGADTGKAKLRAIFDRLIQETLDDGDHKGCFMTNATLEMLPHYADIVTIVCGNFERMEAMLRTIVGEGIRSGEFRADLSLDDILPFLISQLAGLRILAKTSTSASLLNRVVDMALRVL